VKDARTDRARIERWWTEWPHANVGVGLEPAGLLLLDTDSAGAVREAHYRSGLAGLPPSPIARTGRGDGWHRYYRRPADCPITTAIHQGTSAAIDVLTSGYGILPPSRHRSGRLYAWEAPPDASALGLPPRWSVALLEARIAARPVRVQFARDATTNGAAVWARARGHLTARIVRAVEVGPSAYVPCVGGDPTPSGADAAVCYALVRLGLTDSDVRAIFQATLLGQTGKYARRGDPYLATTLATARGLAETVSEMSEPPPHASLRVEVA
jgi:hypothetical protein